MDKDALQKLNEDVYQKAAVDREHLVMFLRLVPTNDGAAVREAVENWLNDIHQDPKFSHIHFAQGEIEAVLADLGSYGYVQAATMNTLTNHHEAVIS